MIILNVKKKPLNIKKIQNLERFVFIYNKNENVFNKTHIFAVRLNIFDVFGIKTKVHTFTSNFYKN